MLDLGQGQGPMDHGYVLDKKDQTNELFYRYNSGG